MNSSNSSDMDSKDSQQSAFELLEFICCIAIILVSLLGITGNVTAIRYFSRKSSGSRSTVNILLIALSTFDIILLCTGAPIYSIWGICTFDGSGLVLLAVAYFMTVLYPFSNMAQMGSILIMMLISIERWLGVCHPFLARRKLTVRRVRICVIMVAIFSVVYNACRFWEYAVGDDGTVEPYLRENPEYLSIYVHWMYFAFVFCIPFLVILVFNGLVAVGVRRAVLNRPRCQLTVQQKRERKTTFMLLVVVAVFLICNSLSWPLNAFETFGYNQNLNGELLDFLNDLNNLLVLSHPTLNIFVYMYFSHTFRRKLCGQFCKCWPWKRSSNMDDTNRMDYSVASDYNSPLISRKRKSSAGNCLLTSKKYSRNHRHSSAVTYMDIEINGRRSLSTSSRPGFGAFLAPLKTQIDAMNGMESGERIPKTSTEYDLRKASILVKNLLPPSVVPTPESV